MSVIDFVIMLVLGLGVARGIMAGGIDQVISLVSVIISLSVVGSFWRDVEKILSNIDGIPDQFLPLVSILVVFLIVQLIFFVLAMILKSAIKKLKLNFLDKTLGGIVGGIKAVLVVSLVLFAVRFVNLPDEGTRQQSMFYDVIYPIMPAAIDLVMDNAPDMSEIDEDSK